MQEVMLHFLFFIGLLEHSKLIKSQLHNTHNKNCKHMPSLESFLSPQHSMLTSLGQWQSLQLLCGCLFQYSVGQNLENQNILVINVWKYMYMHQARGVHDYESEVTTYVVQVKIKFRLKFFKAGRFSIFFVSQP